MFFVFLELAIMTPVALDRRASMRSKGERTVARILDAAETLFAERGYDGASLRQIAGRAGIQQPGLYNYFENKQALYAAVLDRALAPMADAMQTRMSRARPTEIQTTLAAVMTDILLEHPKMAALFQRALQGDDASVGDRLIKHWLDRLFEQAIDTMHSIGGAKVDRVDLAIQTIAMFNLTTGYFLSQRIFETLVGSDITDPDNIARQKKLLNRIVRATLPG
jgi:AcrR family transcriptional regulator